MIPSSACPPWQSDQAGPAGERGDHAAAATPRPGARSTGLANPCSPLRFVAARGAGADARARPHFQAVKGANRMQEWTDIGQTRGDLLQFVVFACYRSSAERLFSPYWRRSIARMLVPIGARRRPSTRLATNREPSCERISCLARPASPASFLARSPIAKAGPKIRSIGERSYRASLFPAKILGGRKFRRA
jgi:hypothetical protein